MGNYYAEDVEYLLLKAVSECREPVGAGFLAETFANRKDLALSEATIGSGWSKRVICAANGTTDVPGAVL